MKHPLNRDVPFALAQERADLAAAYELLETQMREVVKAALPQLPNAITYVSAVATWHGMHMRLEDRQVPVGDTTLYDYPQSSALLIKATMAQFANWIRGYKRANDRLEELVTELVNRQLLHFIQYMFRHNLALDESLRNWISSASGDKMINGGAYFFTFEGLQTTIIEVYIIDALLFGKKDGD